MEAGEILVDEDPAAAAQAVLEDGDQSLVVVFEACAGGGPAHWLSARARFRATVAAFAARLGAPNETPMRSMGLPSPPRYMTGAWVEAAAWRLVDRLIVVTLSGSDRKACMIEIVQEPR